MCSVSSEHSSDTTVVCSVSSKAGWPEKVVDNEEREARSAEPFFLFPKGEKPFHIGSYIRG